MALNTCEMWSNGQRWIPRRRPWPPGRPRGHIFKSLALASKPQVLENCPVLGSRTELFFEWLKFCRSAEKCFSRPFFFEDRQKKNFKTFFLRKTLAFVSLASSIPVLGLVLGFFCVLDLGLEPCVLDSTSANGITIAFYFKKLRKIAKRLVASPRDS